MSKASRTDWQRLAAQTDEQIDTSDVPELGDAFFKNAELHIPPKQAGSRIRAAVTKPV